MKKNKAVSEILLFTLCAALIFSIAVPAFALGVKKEGKENAVVRQWSWVDTGELLTGDAENGYTLVVAGEYSEEAPLLPGELGEYLPAQVTAEIVKPVQPVETQQQAEKTPAAEPDATAEPESGTVTLALTWDLSEISGDGVYKGSYVLRAALPDGYALAADAPALEITLIMDTPFPLIDDAVLKANQLKTTTPVNTKVNLFDYWVYGSQTSNDWIQQDKLNPVYSSYTAGINAGHPLLIGNGMGVYDGNYNYGLWNTSATSWMGNHVNNNYSYIEGIVANRLGDDGMPQLNMEGAKNTRNIVSKVYNAWDKDASLGYLFDPAKSVDGRAAYQNVRNLFTLSGGNYRFKSSANYAQFIKDKSVVGSDGYFNVYNTWAVKNGNHDGGNFAPFNTVQQLLKDNGAGILTDAGVSCTQNQKPAYKASATSDAQTSADATINHYLGMTMETSFIQPDGGVIKGGGDDAGEPMIFTFTGDNDVWIFIDGVLVGDLGGIHSESFIGIDFSTGYIYRGPVKKDGSIPSLTDMRDIFVGQGDSEGNVTLSFTREEKSDYYAPTAYGAKIVFSRTTIKAMHDAARDNTQTWREGGYTYADQTVHTLKFFYMERGGYDTNLSLDFNLVSVPHSVITKVTQDREPVENARFELYATNYDPATGETTIRSDYNGGKALCTASTDASGRLMLVDDFRRIIQFEELAQKGVTSYILRETEIPLGYRSRADVPLYYENGLVFARDYLRSGAYTTAILNVTMDNRLYNLDNPAELLVDTSGGDMQGIIFAVPLKLDSAHVGEFRKDDPNLGKLLHPIFGSFDSGWNVMAEGADLLNSQEDKAAIVTAAKSYNQVAEKNSRNVYAMTLDNIPGAAQNHYWYNYTYAINTLGLEYEALNEYIAENTQYIIAFYYAPRAESMDELTANMPIYRISDMNFEKEYTTNMHIPNTFNRFRVQKMDYHGDWVAGATFGLYQLYCEYDRDGSGEQYLQVSIYGKKYFINTRMFNLTQADLAAIRAGAASGTPVDVLKAGADGTPIHSKQKTYDQIKADWDLGEGNRTVTPWDTATTTAKSTINGLELHGTAMFPSAYSSREPGDPNPYDVKNTSTYLEMGYYLLLELDAPVNHVLNKNVVPVEVTDESIYADAGKSDNGIRVGKYVGFPQSSMRQFAMEEAIDGTLTFLKTQLKIVTSNPNSGQQAEDKDVVEGLTTYRYKYDNVLGYYQRYFEEDETSIYLHSAPNLYMFTSQGHPVLRVYQDDEQERYTISLKDNYSNNGNTNQNGKLLLRKVLNGRKTYSVVNVNDGQACYRLQPGQTVSEYWFYQYESGTSGTISDGVQIYPELSGTGEHHDFVINNPNVEDCGDRDISNLFAVSTIVQVYDLDQGVMTVKAVVEPENHPDETKPFYFRLYALYDEVTEIQLFEKNNPDGSGGGKSNFSGVLNVRIGLEKMSAGSVNPGEYDEAGVRNIPVEFKQGVAKLWLTQGYSIKRVYIPEDEGHAAHGCVAFIPYKIKLEDEGADFNGQLYVSARRVATQDLVKTQPIQFTNGEAIYYAANATTITNVSTGVQPDSFGSAGKEYNFTASCRYATANASELFDENPTKHLSVVFDTSQAKNKDIIVWTSETDTNMVDVTKEGADYFLNVDEQENSNPFLGGKAVTADFALYDGQSITINNMPCGLTYFVQEWSLGASPAEMQYDENNSAYQLLTEKYTTTTTTGSQTEAGDPEMQHEYQQQFRTFKSIIRPDLTREVVFHNYPLLGSLVIENTVTGRMGDRNQAFNFSITLADTDINGDYGGVQFINGTATFQLKHGERMVVPGLPNGAAYTVKEEPILGYDTTYTQTKCNEDGKVTETLDTDAVYTSAGVSGTIVADAQNRVEFTNNKDAEPDTGIVLESLPYVAILAVVIVGVIWMIIRRRRRDD
ncbi:MAG: DUF5979 domain-containing protein [Eubacteriales bacterium]|nr:DUF5979 domain-containing protein [Eubacteriales bacterium]